MDSQEQDTEPLEHTVGCHVLISVCQASPFFRVNCLTALEECAISENFKIEILNQIAKNFIFLLQWRCAVLETWQSIVVFIIDIERLNSWHLGLLGCSIFAGDVRALGWFVFSRSLSRASLLCRCLGYGIRVTSTAFCLQCNVVWHWIRLAHKLLIFSSFLLNDDRLNFTVEAVVLGATRRLRPTTLLRPDGCWVFATCSHWGSVCHTSLDHRLHETIVFLVLDSSRGFWR